MINTSKKLEKLDFVGLGEIKGGILYEKPCLLSMKALSVDVCSVGVGNSAGCVEGVTYSIPQCFPGMFDSYNQG